jgi:hypothetical protein
MSEKKRIQPIVKTNWRAVAWIVGGVFLPWIWAMFLLPLSVSLILAVCAAGVCVVLI